jgi:GH25 family lysozyme M1 (1,4-beta-N-acetylmuramidase)
MKWDAISKRTAELEAKREALYCLDLLKKYEISPSDLFFPVAFDIEYDKALRTGKRNCTDMTLAFCETIKEAGYEPMIYSSASYLEHNLIYSEIKDYKLWVANYEAAGPAFGKPYAMWQYSEDGKVDGIKDLCDMNYWYTSYIEAEELKTDSDSLTLRKGDTSTLNISILPSNATNQRLTFKSSNKNVVKILNEQTGSIEAVGKGKAWITVQTPSGIKEKIQVKVK